MRGAAGLVRVSDWARQMRTEMREPICLKYREGLVRASDWARLH